MRWWMWVGLLAGCDDYFLGVDGAPPDTDTTEKVGWCAVQQLFVDECVVCHSSAAPLGDLDLETDPLAALVGVVSATDPSLQLVVAGNVAASFLERKLTGELTTDEGGKMPPGGTVDAATLAELRQWISDGASGECDEVIDPGGESFHAEGYALAPAHGQEAKLQTLKCVTCHGTDLMGVGDIPSCDGCHVEGWRTDCTFCHGEEEDGTGSPPYHISGEDDGLDASFIPHRAHTTDTALHTAFDCTTCHAKPVDVLSPGHLFIADSTPGVAEMSFVGGLSKAAVWNASTGSCSNLYCHGNGRGPNGMMDHDDTVLGCAQCHAAATTPGRWGQLSPPHDKHLEENIDCYECHLATTNEANQIVDPAVHVNGIKDVSTVPNITVTNKRCTGTCHQEPHTNEAWAD